MSPTNGTNWGHGTVRPQNTDAEHRGAENRRSATDRPQRGTPPRRPRPSYEQMMERRRIAAERRKIRRSIFLTRLCLCLILYVVFCLLIAAFVFSLYRGGASFEGRPLDIIEKETDKDGKEKETAYKIPANKCCTGGVQYVSTAWLSRLYGLTVAGDKERVTVYFHGGDQRLSVYNGSCVVLVNGQPVRLSSKIIFTDDYYLPMELIKTYFTGVIIEYNNEKGRFRLLRDPKADGISLRLKSPEESVPATKGMDFFT